LGFIDISLQQILGASATGVSIILGWLFKTRKRRFTSGYLAKIESVYKEYSANPEECKNHLAQMKGEVDSMLKKGKLDETHFSILDARIARYVRDLS
ncbi:MAG: hypothetical protein V1857_04375, partial [archaeon]